VQGRVGGAAGEGSAEVLGRPVVREDGSEQTVKLLGLDEAVHQGQALEVRSGLDRNGQRAEGSARQRGERQEASIDSRRSA
jgi:hypothetical protein